MPANHFVDTCNLEGPSSLLQQLHVYYIEPQLEKRQVAACQFGRFNYNDRYNQAVQTMADIAENVFWENYFILNVNNITTVYSPKCYTEPGSIHTKIVMFITKE